MKFTYLWGKLLKKMRGSALKNAVIHNTSKAESGSLLVNVTMSAHSFCGYNCEIINCKIGSFCSIANGVIIGGGMHPINWVSTSPVFYEGRDSVKAKFSTHKRASVRETVIGHDVWIGQNSIIKEGVNIGTGAIVGMGSVVTKDVEPYTIVAGCPAIVIRKRFNDCIASKLLESRWWEFDEKKLYKYSELFTKPEQFLKAINI